MSGLIIPRVLVNWAGENLTLYSKEPFSAEDPQPLVFDVSVTIQKDGSAPTASMKWNPSGAAFKVYEKFITEKTKEPIYIAFFYEGGRTVSFMFFWSGQKISYGNDMSVDVKMKSNLDGLVNANVRSTAKNSVESRSQTASAISALELIKEKEELYKLKDKQLMQYEADAERDLKKMKVANEYGVDKDFVSSVGGVMKENGVGQFLSNINGENKVVAMNPYSFGVRPEGTVLRSSPTQNYFSNILRNGYLIGPSIINQFTRDMEWTQPQKNNTSSSRPHRKANDSNAGTSPSTRTQSPPTQAQVNQQQTGGATRAVLGSVNSRTNPNIRNAENKDGPTKKISQESENANKISVDLLMCPAFVGIKPHDILFVPSLQTDSEDLYIEDYVVNQVTYTSTNGSVALSIEGTRTYGLGTLMQPEAGKPFKALAATLKTLQDWQKYAWDVPASSVTN